MGATGDGETFFSHIEFCIFGHSISWKHVGSLDTFWEQQHNRDALLNVLVTLAVQ